jgi:hypothetical protein
MHLVFCGWNDTRVPVVQFFIHGSRQAPCALMLPRVVPRSFYKNREGIVRQGVSYRGYSVFHDGTEYVAEPKVNDGDNFEISSSRRENLYAAIDELWAYLNAAKSIDEDLKVPSWYQSWLDDGASGRVRILDCGRHESIAPKRARWWERKRVSVAMISACLAITAIAISPTLDVSGDGRLSSEDLKVMVDKVHMAFPPKIAHQRVRWGKHVYDVDLQPAPEDNIDFDAHEVRVNGALIQAITLPSTVLNSR